MVWFIIVVGVKNESFGGVIFHEDVIAVMSDGLDYYSMYFGRRQSNARITTLLAGLAPE